MVFNAADNTNPNSLASRQRQKRLQWFKPLLDSFPEPVLILDVGGTADFWKVNGAILTKRCHITLLNLTHSSIEGMDHIESIIGDARKLDGIKDKTFSICFSNSVIEHVGTLYDQLAMANEVRRVAHAYFIQTPNRYFPLEAHFLFPFWNWLPIFFRSWMHQHHKLGWMPKQDNAMLARAEVEQIRLLNSGELQALFPDARLLRERLGPFTKSLVAYRKTS